MRSAALWIGSVAATVVMLWIARSQFGIAVVPDSLEIVSPTALVIAALLHPLYAWLRAMRLGYGLDPLVAAASTEGRRFDRAALVGSGWLSFLVLLVLPLKLGEASRPVLLARARQPGVGLAEAVGVVGLERIIDGVIICTMLFVGLAIDDGVAAASEQRDLVRGIGRAMGGLFLGALVVAIVASRAPARWGDLVARVLGFAPAFAQWSRHVVVRVAESFAALLGASRVLPLVATSVLYWAVTVAQLAAVAAACGVTLGWSAAAATVAIIGLSIQLPGGPAQAGTFQVGAAAAMALFVPEGDVVGRAARVDAFIATMFALPLLGAVVMALPGAYLVARAARADAARPAAASP